MNIKTHWIKDIPKDLTPFGLIWILSKPYRWLGFVALLFAGLASGVHALIPLVYKHLVDTITQVSQSSGSMSQIWYWCLMYVAAVFGNGIFWRAVGVWGGLWVGGMRATGRDLLTRHLFGHSHQYFEDRFAGSISSKISNAIEGAYGLVENFFWQLWPLLVGLTVSSVLTFSTNKWVGWTFVLWLVILIPLNIILAKKKLVHTIKSQELETALKGRTVDFLTNIRAVQEFGREALEVLRLRGLIHERRKAGYHNRLFGEGMTFLNSILQAIFMLIMLGTTLWLAAQGQVSMGSVILVLTLVLSVGSDILWIGNNISYMSDRWGEITEGLKDIYVPYDITPDDSAMPMKIASGDVLFEKVDFAYGESNDVLSQFTLSIPSGTKVGLVGKSGAGKSTLIKLLLRHYDVTGGKVTIGGNDISQIPQVSVRESIAIVPQEPLLFHRSIRENIAYGKVDATDEEVQKAATLARADKFIQVLPKQYDTMVGERGIKLSGGERQRVAIARAMIKESPILILDEATSSLDSESEKAIQEALHTLMEGKTVIAIAHRLSTLREMDRIIVLDKGKIAEDGTHEELLANKSIYASLWDHQSGGYMKDE